MHMSSKPSTGRVPQLTSLGSSHRFQLTMLWNGIRGMRSADLHALALLMSASMEPRSCPAKVAAFGKDPYAAEDYRLVLW